MLSMNFSPFPHLETDRCFLRQIKQFDAEQVLYLRSDQAVMAFIDKEKMNSMEEANTMVEKIDEALANNNGITWAVCLKKEETMIGTIGFWRLIKEHHRAEIGYTLQPVQWNRGLMTEVMKEVIRFGFKEWVCIA